MYICKECQNRYEQKPEYCDCGNDTFEYTHEKKLLTLQEKSDIISGIFLLLCILLSTALWFIPIKSSHTEVKPKQQKTSVYIPDINKIWNDTPIYQASKQDTTIDDEPIVLTPVMDFVNETVKSKVNKKKEEIKPLKVDEPPKKINPSVPKQKNNNEQLLNSSVPKENEAVKPSYNPNSPQMLRYKSNLRAAMFSKFAVGSIQGSGNCSIQFSVDKSGKLVNRKFIQESDNKSLNDTVYYMLMSVPKYTIPPEGYNGEPIRMNFSINNGNYEISIN